MSIDSIIAQLRPVLKDEIRSAQRALGDARQLLKGQPVRKDSSRPVLAHITAAEAHYRPRLVAALRLGLDARQVAEAWIKKAQRVAKADTEPDDIDLEADSFAHDLPADPSELLLAISAMYGAGYLIGSKEAIAHLVVLGSPRDLNALSLKAEAIDWSTWSPGDAAAAAELAGLEGGAGLQTLVDAADVVVASIQANRLTELGDVLAAGARAGDSVDELASRIEDLLDDPSRAELIANTELNRAVSASTLDTYRDNSIEQFNVLVYDPCVICGDEEAGNPHELDDDPPPYHPGCRCAVAPVISGVEGEAEE